MYLLMKFMVILVRMVILMKKVLIDQIPYSASAASDHLSRSGVGLLIPVIITNCSNNYGANQFPEKLIPLIIINCIDWKELPVYGNGENIRDWLFVEDHCIALETIFLKGEVGDTYNIGGSNEIRNRYCENYLRHNG